MQVVFLIFTIYNPDEEDDLKDSRILLHLYSFIDTYYEEGDDKKNLLIY